MKRKISIILFAGIISMISMGFQSQSSGDNSSNGSKVSMKKGLVSDSNNDGTWDKVTFGVEAPASYYVSYVELQNYNKEPIGIIYDLEGDRIQGISWYAINLDEFVGTDDFDVSNDFFLVIHVVKVKGPGSDNSSLSSGTRILASRPIVIDPEETVLIVKYP